MNALKTGFVGWRGMVGSVLMERMQAENDFRDLDAHFFTTSNIGGKGPAQSGGAPLLDAKDLKALSSMEVIVSCQGGDYTTEIFAPLRASGWKGIWIDAASTLRMVDHAMIVLDPINGQALKEGLKNGIKDFIGGNCTTSLMLMALHGLFRENLIEWVSSMTYQAASGAGAANMIELMKQMSYLGQKTEQVLAKPEATAISLEKAIHAAMREEAFPVQNFGAPLAGSLIPWIDKAVEAGQTKEEWKGYVEANKILGSQTPIGVDGLCVRIGALRCHSMAYTIKLKKALSADEACKILDKANPWVSVVPNDKASTLKALSPAAVSGSLNIALGRVRPSPFLGKDMLTAFSVGDQLLWGAAEPLRRMLRIVQEEKA